jgi:hypothetical protein
MAQLRIPVNNTFDIDVEVRESDKYSEQVYLKFERRMKDSDSPRSCDKLFLSPKELETLGRFLIRQADDIRTAQDVRHMPVE